MHKVALIALSVALLLVSISSGACGSVHVSVTLDKVNYAPDETVYAIVRVQDESNRSLANQLVLIDWTGPSSSLIREDRALTEASGTVQASLHLNVTSALGMYLVQVASSNSTATVYFQVESLRTFSLTVVMPDANIPIWVNGIQRSQGNTTLILAQGTYTVEVPNDYQGASFKMWQTKTQNLTNPHLTIQLSQETTITAIYEPNATTQTVNWLFPYLWPVIIVAAVVLFLAWIYREGYFEGII
jgi:hypothetical protein